MYLNCHTCFSFKYGTIRPEELLQEAVACGVHRFAVTDINNTSAILDCHRLAGDYPEKYPVQPVAGIDFRLTLPPDARSSRAAPGEKHFIGIAKNHHGFFELNRFLSECLHRGETGLTGRTAILTGPVPCFEDAFLIYPFPAMQQMTATMLRPNEYVGIRPADLNRLQFSHWKNDPAKLVVLAPVTFRNHIAGCRARTDFNAHRLLRAMDHNTLLSKLPAGAQALPDEVMVPEEMLAAQYRHFPLIVANTRKLLDACEPIRFEFGKNKNKEHFLDSVAADREQLIRLCEEGMLKRYPDENEKVRERFNKEIDVITGKKFSAYFLINHDIIQFARRNNLFYVGRGSGANSMVAYLLYITDVDPIELDLYFERFINPSRKNPPDFDLDFSSDERDRVIEHIFKKHGPDHTALLATYSEMKRDSLLRELGKVFGLPKKEIDALQDDHSHPETDPHLLRLIRHYMNVLQTFPAHLGIHSGGILISQQPICCYTALSNPPKGFPVTQFSMQEAEDVGFAKFDILAQRGLGKVRDAVDIIRENRGVSIDIHDVARFKKDAAVRDNLKRARLMGCFYVESPAMRMLLTKLRAETYLDLVAASSIIRPGVAQSGMMQEYIRRFHEKDHGRSRAIPELWDIMEETFGVMVYQEDVIKVAYHYGGFTLEEADKLRRGMGGKYRGRKEFLDVKDTFFENCRRSGKDARVTEAIWYQMETFGGYAFAKGHSASYAVESYQCMFLKTHYPLEYMVAVINNGGGFFGIEHYLHEARMCGGTIHAPDINRSEALTTLSGNHIWLGLGLLKDFESRLLKAILAGRQNNGAFTSLANFIRRVAVPVEQLRILIRIGAFRFTGRTKKQLLWDVHTILGRQRKSVARRELFEGESKKYALPELFYDAYEDARDEMEILNFPLCSPFTLIAPAGHEMLAADLPRHLGKVIELTGYYVTRKPTVTKKGERMMFGCFLDCAGCFFDTNHFPEATRRFPFRGKGCYRVKGRVAEEFGFYSINVMELHKLEYLMHRDDAEAQARARPDPVVVPPPVPASKQFQYRCVMVPPPHIHSELMALKKLFHRRFDHYRAVVTLPYVTLLNVAESEAREPELIKLLACVTEGLPPVRILLDGFGSVPPHTLCLKLPRADAVADVAIALKQKLEPAFSKLRCATHPHLIMADHLSREKLARASAEFSGREYAASFTAATVVLLRREEGSKSSRDVMVKSFALSKRMTAQPAIPTAHPL